MSACIGLRLVISSNLYSYVAPIKYLNNERLRTLNVGRGGALAESTPFVRRVTGSTPAVLAATYWPWASPSLTVARGALEWNPGTVSVLCRERLWVVKDLKRRYRNSMNEWMNEWIEEFCSWKILLSLKNISLNCDYWLVSPKRITKV